MNLYDLAMEKELEVKAYYEKLADEAVLPGVKNIFLLLASDEQKHFEAVRELKKKSTPGALIDSPALETAREVLTGFFGDPVPAAKMNTCLDSYRTALLIEAESIQFYEGALEHGADANESAMLAAVLEQERMHYSIIENLYEYVLRPEYYLEWAEFSNLRPL